MTVARASMRSRSCTSIPWSALIVGPAYRCARSLQFLRSMIYLRNGNITLGSTRVTSKVASSDRKSTRLNSSHEWISYAVFCLKKKKKKERDKIRDDEHESKKR